VVAYFRDINFFSPTTKPEVVDAEAIRQELAMLFNTRPTERLFDPEYGIALDAYLFDLITQESADDLYFEIVAKVEKYVQSVVIDSRVSEVVPDPDNNTYTVNLYFNITGASDDGTYQMTKSFKNR
jgi:phage baseplate assembly protein W